MNLATYIRNEGLIIILFISWLLMNGFLFFWCYFTMRFDDKFHYMYLMLGEVIFLARGTGILLNFNCALVLLPMNKFINSWIRSRLFKNTKGSFRRLFDHSKGIHITLALTICILSVVHTALHIYNFFSFKANFSNAVPDINLQNTRGRTTLLSFCATIPGFTGLIMLVIALLLSVSSFKAVRRLHHNLFDFLHYLSSVFLIVLMFHGFGKITKYQTNLDQHPLQCHHLDGKIKLEECKAEPSFNYVQASSWKWLAASFIIHIIDRLIRLWCRWQECDVISMNKTDSDVIELVLSKKGFKAKPGQYVRLQCAEISEFEWHAFTLTKCPSKVSDGEQTFSVHIKVVGDWTMRLANLVKSTKTKETSKPKPNPNDHVIDIKDGATKENKPIKLVFRIDGPYGSPHEDAFRFPINISIATGIGITPFLATIRDLKNYERRTTKGTFKLKKFHLIWVCRSIKEFIWILDEIDDVEQILRANNVEDLLDIRIFVTQEKVEQIQSYLPSLNVDNEWVSSKVKYGRPFIKSEIETIISPLEKERVGIFYCGSPTLGKKIYTDVKNLKRGSNILIFNKESFG
uniref:FAD-binding FR-type domain-containing protein n=1 Tax=Clytia hemisphaerica TaxID=252671 RepID=A0A7M5URT9_9CNID